MLLDGKPLKYHRAQVLDRLKANREKHVADFDEAMAGYQQKRFEAAQALYGFVANNPVLMPTDDVGEFSKQVANRLSTLTSLTKPISYVDSYDSVIDQLGMTADGQVDMDQTTFDTYMRDQWAWKKGFEATTSTYKGGKN